MECLILPIKKQWFDMIATGEKKEEYREIKPYYDNRLKKYMSKEFFIIFRNGYTYDSPSVKCKCKLRIGQGKPEWGAEEGKEYYILEILEIVEIRNWNNIALELRAVVTLPDTLTESFQEAITNVVNIEIKDIASCTEQELREAIRKATAELGNTMRFGGNND